VREEIPDVQELRPEASASLAAIVDRATAKDLLERYRSDEELIADLEEVLALETTRSGHATGEATTVLRTLPSRTRRRLPLPLRMRRPAWLALGALVATAAAVVAVIALLGDHAQSGTGTVAPDRAAVQARLAGVSLAADAAHDFDPLGDQVEHRADTPSALDGDPSTYWTTETYQGGVMPKKGVGIYLDAKPSANAARLDVATPTPGFSADVYVAGPGRAPTGFPSGWTKVASMPSVASRAKITFDRPHQARYVLLWITKLPPGGDHVQITQLSLYQRQ
jgi:serine/threonine-protein kinase